MQKFLERFKEHRLWKYRAKRYRREYSYQKSNVKWWKETAVKFANRIIELEDKYEKPRRYDHGAYCEWKHSEPCNYDPHCDHTKCNGYVGCGCHCHNSGTPLQVASGQQYVRGGKRD